MSIEVVKEPSVTVTEGTAISMYLEQTITGVNAEEIIDIVISTFIDDITNISIFEVTSPNAPWVDNVSSKVFFFHGDTVPPPKPANSLDVYVVYQTFTDGSMTIWIEDGL